MVLSCIFVFAHPFIINYMPRSVHTSIIIVVVVVVVVAAAVVVLIIINISIIGLNKILLRILNLNF